MRNLLFAVAIAGLAAAPAPSDEGVRVRYTDPTGRITLKVDQDISVGEHPSIAARTLLFDLALESEASGPAIGVTVEKAGGTYTAHGMEQRLSARHLTGKKFAMSIENEGGSLSAEAPSAAPMIHVGPPVERGVPIAETLVGVLPRLPAEPVIRGASWKTEHPIHSLEGWAWGAGMLSTTHEVTGIQRQGGHQIVSIHSEATASLTPMEGASGFTGSLTQSFDWRFDASVGRLLSLSMEQKSKGTCPLPQGPAEIVQVTKVVLEPSTSG